MSDRIDELVRRKQLIVCLDCPHDIPCTSCEPSQRFDELATIAREADIERKRGDFFRDALVAARGCPPSPVEVACQEGDPCPFLSDDGYPDYAACWDEVERRQR